MNNKGTADNQQSANKISAEDIIGAIKSPTRSYSPTKCNVTMKKHRMTFSKEILLLLNWPTNVAFSFPEGMVFVIPNPVNLTIPTFKLSKAGTYKCVVNSKDLTTDIRKHLKITAKETDRVYFKLEEYMSIKGHTVYNVKVVDSN